MLERITKRERHDLFVAWLGITIAFTLAIVLSGSTGKIDPLYFLFIFGVAAITVGIGFVLHEMAHKFTAMKYGYYAEFRKDNVMLLMAVVLAALVHIVFAAPGATVIYAEGLTKEQNGKISAAGPLTNLLLCIPFGALILSAPYIEGIMGSVIGFTGMMGLQINAMIAAFNMLPISILDGRKVLAWNPAVFIVMIAVSIAILYVSLTMVPLYL
ncbi:MAG TPA: peptidase M50 [Methanoregulaceae archaeon]|nr:peptidase M50 [Methanoregulaceae archaeon]